MSRNRRTKVSDKILNIPKGKAARLGIPSILLFDSADNFLDNAHHMAEKSIVLIQAHRLCTEFDGN